MKHITFYSTKIFSEGTLFYKAQELSSPQIISYFEESVPEEAVPEFTQSSWWNLYKRYQIDDDAFLKLIKEHISSDPDAPPYEVVEDEFIKSVKAALADQVDDVSRGFYEEISSVIPKCLDILRDEIVEKKRIERNKFIQNLSKVYSLPAKQVQDEEKRDQYYAYAIKALEKKWSDDENGSKNWIGKLIEAAKDLAGIKDNETYEIQLVLHDKDLGGKYVTRDVYVLDSKQIGKYTPDQKCHIIFFKHTSNEFVNLLRNRELTSLDIYKKVNDTHIKYSKKLELIKDLDQSPYDKTESETKKSIEDLKNKE